ncbi:hypothetical protein FBU30_003775 [Linnemannia zychae]|nr:hypothetical protein FBU30_003775 [Linnemannia zychae]
MPLSHPWTKDDVGCGLPPILTAELAMMAASNAVREKPQWWEKLKDPELVLDYRFDFGVENYRRDYKYRVSEKQLDYVFKELEWYSQKVQDQLDQGITAPIELGIECTRRCDGLVPVALKNRLLACVKKLEDVPAHKKDWHPGSSMRVLDLVHPSLYPFIAGRTRVTSVEAIPALEYIGKGEIMAEAPIKRHKQSTYYSADGFHSKKFQWLPTDFDVTSDGKVKAKSYINNLHPKEHKELYPVLEEILELFLPMFEQVLGDLDVYETRSLRLTTDPFTWYGEKNEELLESGKVHYYDFFHDYYPRPVEIPEFTPRKEHPNYNLRTGKPLQVIVKLANIELNPENPKYEGGSWHVEGMANEDIVATGIYYYQSENITESRLNFRIQVKEPDYRQFDVNGLGMMYDLYDEYPLVQKLDGIITKQDRCIVFPNIYQHCVQPFELEDQTKPGFRKILVFFLVSPETTVLSTTHVPPQQMSWFAPELASSGLMNRIPPEIFQQVADLLASADLEKAKELREELMKERKFLVKANKGIFERPFSLCEH